ncbi:ferredoxin [Candidatus Bathyarchaeota archaeon]|nr:ferredoxin [Candidatus Bathyarchaeota archaeon]MBS7631021.1 ferredoxin [Candidatus Bathyarchaeota archaeon]
MPFNVVIDREGCISCCNCHTNCPDVFELSSEDGRSQIKKEFRQLYNDLKKGVVPDSFEECVSFAEDSCPVSIIHVTKLS